MKEVILTAKEWLEKEEVYNSYIDHSKQGEEIGLIQFSEIMEKYANYNNKILEDRIKGFSNQLTTISKAPTYPGILQDIKNQYDKHFNIK